MKLIEKKRLGSQMRKTYESPQTPCARIPANGHVSEETKQTLRAIHHIVEEIEERRTEERWRAGEVAAAIPPGGDRWRGTRSGSDRYRSRQRKFPPNSTLKAIKPTTSGVS